MVGVSGPRVGFRALGILRFRVIELRARVAGFGLGQG